MDRKNKVRAVILGGGVGSRLGELTGDFRPKPLIPLQPGRLLDYAVSNALNANGLVLDIVILVQAFVNEMLEYIQEVYQPQHTSKHIIGLTAPMMNGPECFEGTADAVRKTTRLFDDCAHLLVLAGDHLCQVEFPPIIEQHLDEGMPCTVLVQRVRCSEAAGRFGVFTVNEQGIPIAFTEKPIHPAPIPGTEDMCLASLGMYLFHSATLKHVLLKECPEGHDFGKDVIPNMLERREVRVAEYNGYWRDLGNPLAYHSATMDLLGPNPEINLYDTENRPIIRKPTGYPATKLYGDCRILNSSFDAGSRIGGSAFMSMCGQNVHLSEGAEIHRSIVFDNSYIEGDVHLTNTIVDVDCVIGCGVILGKNIEEELSRFPQIRAYDGIIVVPHHTILRIS